MGMDVYGNDPKIQKSINDFPIYAKYEDMPWGDREKDPQWEKVKDKFWEEYNAYEDVVFYVKKTNYALDRVSLQKVFLYISKFRTDHIIERYNLNIKEVV